MVKALLHFSLPVSSIDTEMFPVVIGISQLPADLIKPVWLLLTNKSSIHGIILIDVDNLVLNANHSMKSNFTIVHYSG